MRSHGESYRRRAHSCRKVPREAEGETMSLPNEFVKDGETHDLDRPWTAEKLKAHIAFELRHCERLTHLENEIAVCSQKLKWCLDELYTLKTLNETET